MTGCYKALADLIKEQCGVNSSPTGSLQTYSRKKGQKRKLPVDKMVGSLEFWGGGGAILVLEIYVIILICDILLF